MTGDPPLTEHPEEPQPRVLRLQHDPKRLVGRAFDMDRVGQVTVVGARI